MQTFEIKEQVKLPLMRCVELVLDGIQFRLLRSLISVAIVGLAVAFMTTILAKSLIERQITVSIDNFTYPRRLLVFWINRLSTPITEDEISRILCEGSPTDARWKELMKWGECTDVNLQSLAAVANKERKYLRFFNELTEGKRRAMVGQATGYQIFMELQKNEVFEKFKSELTVAGKKFPGTVAEFKEFLKLWHTTQPLREKIIRGNASSVAEIAKIFGSRPIMEVISEFNDEMRVKLESLGFSIPADEFKTVMQEARKNVKFKVLTEWFENSKCRNKFAVKYGIKDMKRFTPDIVFAHASTASGAEDVMKILKDAGIRVDIDIVELRNIAQQYVEQKQLAEMETNVAAFKQDQGLLGFSSRILWLCMVSILVCIVGVTNAMLMSVTERFKEIATMKCLGATDSFIMLHFMIESCLLGVLGGITGAVAGLLLGMLSASTYYGALVFRNFPVFALLGAAIVSIIVGTFISIIAAIYPARVAARLAPMEAMRVE